MVCGPVELGLGFFDFGDEIVKDRQRISMDGRRRDAAGHFLSIDLRDIAVRHSSVGGTEVIGFSKRFETVSISSSLPASA